MAKNNWSYDETLMAFELYCRTPFAKISERNKEIIKLAEVLKRSPKSVKMKMFNLARLNPEEIARGIVSLQHGAKLENEIWKEYSIDRENLILKAAKLRNKQAPEVGIKGILSDTDIFIPDGDDIQVEAKRRIGQAFFRSAVLSAYDFKCCMTGINVLNFLVASHIKPWRDSSSQEKTDPRNGLCLNALHDKAFDQGFITVDKNYKIIVAEKFRNNSCVDEVTRMFIICKDGMDIILPDKFRPSKEFLEYHNDVKFGKF